MLALAIALASAGATAVTARRLSQADQRALLYQQQAEQAQANLDALRQRLGQGGGSVLDRIAAAVEQLRGLQFKRPVAATVLTDAELRRRVLEQVERDTSRADIEKSAKVLRALGLLGAGQDLYRIIIEVQQEQIAGYFDVKTKKMVVGGDARDPSPLDRVALAHEYTHALTDQHFGLGALETLNDQHKDDEALAYLSLVEGDATYLMFEYARDVLTREEKVEYLREQAQIKSPKLDAAPVALRATLLFPYLPGQEFVAALYEHGGNAAIDRAYRAPPTSTEQILHPEKFYAKRDDPTAVTLPDLATSFGSGWRALIDGGVGEFDVRLILDQYLPQRDAEEAAEGWDGGRFAAVEGAAGVVVASLTAWDSNAEASEAEDVFVRWLPQRYGRRGAAKRIEGSSGHGWDGPGGAAQIVRDGARLLIIAGPDFDSVDRARRSFPGF